MIKYSRYNFKSIIASFISCIHYDDLFDRIQVYLRLQKIAKQNPKYYSKLSSGPFAWKSINESWGQKVKPCSKFFPNPDDELAKKELRTQEHFQICYRLHGNG